MDIKYLGDTSTGHAFEIGETRTVVVTAEELDVESGYEGDPVTYTAHVVDSTTAKVPASFRADLIINGTIIIDDQWFEAAVYSQSTGLLTLVFDVPAIAVGNYTVKLDWEDQVLGASP